MVRAAVTAVLVTVASLAQAAGVVTVVPDRTTVNENESLTVVYSYSEELENEPDFSALQENFDILGQNRQSSLQSINGRFSYKLSWTLTLMPRRVGEVELPPVDFDGVKAEPITITVKAAPQDSSQPLGDLALEVEFTPREGYVQGQFIFTQRLYHRGWLAGGELTDPDFGDADAVVRQLEQTRRYSLFRGGERYQVFEQSYLVFPQRSGELRAAPSVFTGQLREPGRSPRLKRVSAPAESVDVRPVPASVRGPFLPATELTLEETWPDDPIEFEQGRPVTREVRIMAKGLTAAQLPEIEFPEVDGMRVYADQARRDDQFAQDGVTGTVEQSVALVPQRGGNVVLPAIEIEWWDTGAGRARVARLPAREIAVRGAQAATPPPTRGAVTIDDTPATTVEVVGGGWRIATFAMLALGLAVSGRPGAEQAAAPATGAQPAAVQRTLGGQEGLQRGRPEGGCRRDARLGQGRMAGRSAEQPDRHCRARRRVARGGTGIADGAQLRARW